MYEDPYGCEQSEKWGPMKSKTIFIPIFPDGDKSKKQVRNTGELPLKAGGGFQVAHELTGFPYVFIV